MGNGCTSTGDILIRNLYYGIGAGGRNGGGGCTPNTLWDGVTVLQNLLQIGLQVAGLLAVVFLIIGGLMYIMSAGEPARVAKAKATIINAVIGLIISISVIGIIKTLSGIFG